MRHQDLPVEIARLQVARVGQNDLANACRGQFQGNRAAHAATARDEDGCALEPPLAFLAKTLDPHLPLVNLALDVGEGGDGLHVSEFGRLHV